MKLMDLVKGVRSKINIDQLRVIIALLLLLLVVGLINPQIFLPFNLQNVFRSASFNAIAAFGMTFVIMTGNFDISIGSMLAVLMIVSAYLVGVTTPFIALVGTIITGVLIGLWNGFLTVKGKIPSFVVTLGMLWVLRGIAYLATDNNPVYIKDQRFIWLGNGMVFGIPVPFIIMVITFVLFYLLMNNTSFGRKVKAVGDNEKAAFFAAINVDLIKILAFIIVGICIAISATLTAARMYSASPRLGVGYEFQVIAMVILGGTSLKGGKGTLFGSLLGAFFFAFLNNGLNLLGIQAFWQYVAVGLVLIGAVASAGSDLKGMFSS